jgi:hypothetical protein
MGATVEYYPGHEPAEKKLAVADFEVKLERRAVRDGWAMAFPEDGEIAYSMFNTRRFWNETIERPGRRPRIVQREVDPHFGTIDTGKMTIGRRNIVPSSAFTATMLSAWLERGVVRRVGEFRVGEFVPSAAFLAELARFKWDSETKMFWEHGEVPVDRRWL